MMKVDSSTLADVITQCFDNSMDGRFTEEQQAGFLTDGKRLRGLLLNLLSAQFRDGSQKVADANAQLTAVNGELKTSVLDVTQTATTLNNIAGLVSTLDGLLGVAASFV